MQESLVEAKVEQNHSNLLLKALQDVLQRYLDEKPTRSVNGLSRRCVVSEPTLRRILRGQIKTMPTATTVLDILTTISKEKNLQKVAKIYPGVIADYLNSNLPQSEDINSEYNQELNRELSDSTQYVIYKLASNSSGLKKEKLVALFGLHGCVKADHLVKKGYLSCSNDVYFSQVKNFTLNHDTFTQNFKIIADFIKTQSPMDHANLHSLLVNYSESVSVEAYKEIIGIQKRALRRIRDVMSDDKSQGPVPLFLLLAIDTLDERSVHEFEQATTS
jgi:hypothetical protein